MEIKFQWHDCVYSLCWGKKTDWFESIHFFHITREYYENFEVVWAEYILGW